MPGHSILKSQETNRTRPIYVYSSIWATKTIHLELVSDLMTEMFLNALKRFVFWRGKCDSILSDNGKNFLGVRNAANQGIFITSQKSSKKLLTVHLIKVSHGSLFHHMGGLWEANIKSVKTHLKAN